MASSSKTSAIQAINKKGEVVMVPTTTYRYRAGQLPKGVQLESSSDEEEEEVVKVVRKPIDITVTSALHKQEEEVETVSIPLDAVMHVDTIKDARLRRIMEAKLRKEHKPPIETGKTRRDVRAQAIQQRQQEESTLLKRPVQLEEESESETESSSSSEEETVILKPVFIPKKYRERKDAALELQRAQEEEELRRIEKLAMRKESSRKMVERIQQEAQLARTHVDMTDYQDVDDTDDVDKIAEYAAWRLREFARIRQAIQERDELEAEKAELERRRNMTEEERLKEDEERIQRQLEEKESREAPLFMQKYYHKGAFFMDKDEALYKRNAMLPTEGQVKNVEALPRPMQVREYGKMSQTKWTHLTAEDTTDKGVGWAQDTEIAKRTLSKLGGYKNEFDKPTKRKR
jgi:microfibrillar-associated protein 1